MRWLWSRCYCSPYCFLFCCYCVAIIRSSYPTGNRLGKAQASSASSIPSSPYNKSASLIVEWRIKVFTFWMAGFFAEIVRLSWRPHCPPCENCQITNSRMRRDRNYRDFILFRTITPEHSISTWRTVLSVSFEDFLVLIERVSYRGVLVRLQSWVTRVALQQRDGFVHLLEQPFITA